MSELENELEKAKKEFMELVSKELGIPKDLMSKGAVDVEKEQTHFKCQVPKPELDFEKFKLDCDEMSEVVRKMARAEEKRQDEMLILQIIYVYETGLDFWHYKAVMLNLAKENPNGNYRIQMLTNEQVNFINSIKRTSREEKMKKEQDYDDFKDAFLYALGQIKESNKKVFNWLKSDELKEKIEELKKEQKDNE